MKGNQPTLLLLRQLTALPRPTSRSPTGPLTRATAGPNNAPVKLTAAAAAAAAGTGFPGAQLALQITRRPTTKTSRWSAEVIDAITDPGFRDVSPVDLADAARAHWGIENRLH